MGIYINPGNSGFAEINDQDYVDKTLLIDLINKTVEKKNKLTCISRPRRFGKSYAAKMLTAYYDCTCDSHPLFADKKISQTPDYAKYLNQYNVICLDITAFISEAKRQQASLRIIPNMIVDAINKELGTTNGKNTLNENLIDFVNHTHKRIIFIIDEWDAVIREAQQDEIAQQAYLNLLRGWFKNGNFTPKAVAAAYMTGILPIKKDGSQSAISDFNEYTMIKPRIFGEFVGFTESEVAAICQKKNIDFDKMKRWYDGYSFEDIRSIYNPNSVMYALDKRKFKSYWAMSSSATSLLDYINMDFDGLSDAAADLLAGKRVGVRVKKFQNDLVSLRSKDDVLTLLTHFGYLSYDSESETVTIPNQEIRDEFSEMIHDVTHEETLQRVRDSIQLIKDTAEGNADAVAAQIEKIHRQECTPLHYNREQSLRAVIKMAYFAYRDYYLQFEELPGGTGYADIVYLPKKYSDYPALIIELKWEDTPETAIHQIKSRNYPDVLKNFDGDILLVGISYDKEDQEKKHHCTIEVLE